MASSMDSRVVAASNASCAVIDAIRRHPVQDVAERTQYHAALQGRAIGVQADPLRGIEGRAPVAIPGQLERDDHPALAHVGDVRMACERRGQFGHARGGARLRASTSSLSKIASDANAAAQASGLPV